MKSEARARVDVVVVGAGHAGIEAALAASALGCEVALVTTSRATIGHMPCNPAIGGTAKGHLVREIDALGGVMGQAIDATGIQFKLLNRSRGPAVWSPRAQADKILYSQWVTERLEAQAGLDLVYDQVVDIEIGGGATAVSLRGGGKLHCAAVVVTTGTFLNGLTHVGDVSKPEGRYGEAPSTELAACLERINLQTGRLKTGTPPRLDRRSIDFESSVRMARFTEERGDEDPVAFSFATRTRLANRILCWSLYTTDHTHDLVRRNIDDSPLYNGRITGVGPRYCPSLEDKVMRFPHRERHQLHLEPEGLESESIYVNGLSMSLPQAAQIAVVRSLPGLEDSRVIRPGYAVEYDFVQPTALTHALESRQHPGLFLAGQVNGTSGYEEAAAQGLLAGINAARRARKRSPLVLPRQESYIGILVDDLVTQGCLEPYRMFTSRAEHRLLLRIDNADLRLTPVGRRIGLVPDERWQMFEERRARHLQNGETLRTTMVRIGGGRISAARALKRPEIRLANLAGLGVQLDLPDGPESLPGRSLEAEVKYEGYLKQERAEVRRIQRQGARRIPPAFPFESVPGLSREVVERLRERRPATLAHAARVPGVTPAALGILNGCLQRSARSASN
jgi:tRNA uridine 5-carboxymethylaminomethyl modification enzyme